MSKLSELTDKPFNSMYEMEQTLKLGKVGVDALIKSFTKVTNDDLKKHKVELEAINNNQANTQERLNEFKTVTYGQLIEFIKGEKKEKKY
jgi:predicted  nucleic acid-binding Zn-ribbon protein